MLARAAWQGLPWMPAGCHLAVRLPPASRFSTASLAAGCPLLSRAILTAPALPCALQPGEHLAETVELLAACRPAEVALLQSLGGYRKLLMTWR